MTPNWNPSAEQLSAFFDGALDHRAETAALRRRIEIWLETHPEAQEELENYRQLAQLWQDTRPREPADGAWKQVRAELAAAVLMPATRSRRRLVVFVAGVAAMLLALWLGRPPVAPPMMATKSPKAIMPSIVVEVFPVATAGEVTILRVEGADTETLVVGVLPVHGALELAAAGDVTITRVEPAPGDQMRPRVLQGPPMIWARVEAEADER